MKLWVACLCEFKKKNILIIVAALCGTAVLKTDTGIGNASKIAKNNVWVSEVGFWTIKYHLIYFSPHK